MGITARYKAGGQLCYTAHVHSGIPVDLHILYRKAVQFSHDHEVDHPRALTARQIGQIGLDQQALHQIALEILIIIFDQLAPAFDLKLFLETALVDAYPDESVYLFGVTAVTRVLQTVKDHSLILGASGSAETYELVVRDELCHVKGTRYETAAVSVLDEHFGVLGEYVDERYTVLYREHSLVLELLVGDQYRGRIGPLDLHPVPEYYVG